MIHCELLTFHSWTRQIPPPPSGKASDAAGAWEGGPTVPVTILRHSERSRPGARDYRLPLAASRQFLGPGSIEQLGGKKKQKKQQLINVNIYNYKTLTQIISPYHCDNS